MFGRIFDTEAPFWQGVARVGDLVLLNLLLIASSIPLVTFGAAMTALYDTLWRLHDGQGGGTTALAGGVLAHAMARAAATKLGLE